MLPTFTEDKDVDELVVRLHDFNSVTTTLQLDSTSIAHERSLFDAVTSEYPKTGKRLASDSSILHDVDFEHTVRKVTSGNVVVLPADERNRIGICRHLLFVPWRRMVRRGSLSRNGP